MQHFRRMFRENEVLEMVSCPSMTGNHNGADPFELVCIIGPFLWRFTFNSRFFQCFTFIKVAPALGPQSGSQISPNWARFRARMTQNGPHSLSEDIFLHSGC